MGSGIPSFIFGAGAPARTPAEAAKQRAVYEAIVARMSAPKDVGEGLSAVGNALIARSAMDRASAGEEAGKAEMAELFAGLSDGADQNELMGVLGNEWASPGQSAVAQALLNRQFASEDRATARAEPDWKTFESGGDVYRWNANDSDATPSLFHDAPAAEKPLMNVGDGQIYDPNKDTWISNPAAMGEAGGMAPENFDDISGIRKEIQQLPSYKNYSQARPIYNSMVETAGRNSRASDLNLVYGLGKIMDPTSVVREGEMVMVKNTASLPDWLVGTINSLNGGAGLTPETRKAILTEAFGRMQGYEQAFGQDTEQYRGIAERYKINPADVIPNFDAVAPWEPAPAQLPPEVTEEDIIYTMQQHNLSREEVLRRLGIAP